VKTIFYGQRQAEGHYEIPTATAIIELDQSDLQSIGCGDYNDRGRKLDPAKELKKVIEHDRRAAAKLINESGPMHVVAAAVEKLTAYLKAAPKITSIEPADPATAAIEEKGQ
jgi:hypothetical protein